MRKGAAAVAVTQGPDAGDVCLQLIVTLDDIPAQWARFAPPAFSPTPPRGTFLDLKNLACLEIVRVGD
jgi:hypothetical protein